ncbi:MAG: hypothetical protein AAF639_01065 [Chloroflexota bacterium]
MHCQTEQEDADTSQGNEHSQTKIAWLRNDARTHIKSQQLIEKFSDQGMDIWVMNVQNFPVEKVICFDFFMLEYADTETTHSQMQPISSINHTLQDIRSSTFAPLVILIEGQEMEQVLHVIESGADAILPINTASEVILARCQALLRRWNRFNR